MYEAGPQFICPGIKDLETACSATGSRSLYVQGICLWLQASYLYLGRISRTRFLLIQTRKFLEKEINILGMHSPNP